MKYYSFKNIRATGIAEAICTPKGIGNWSVNDPEAVKNYALLGNEFGLTPNDMVRAKQVHSANVRVITREDAGEGIVRPLTHGDVDALVTNVPGLMLCTVEADCTPVYLLDPVKKAIAMIHSGWKGTAAMISANAISVMHETYGSDPKDLLAAIGPCNCGLCYEVSDDLIPPFREGFGDDTERYFTAKDNGKYLLDLKRAVHDTLVNSGIPAGNIETSPYCTYHDDLFYSWRKDKDPLVRMLTAIYLK